MIKELVFGIFNIILSSILSYILTKFNISLELSICIGVIFFLLLLFFNLIYAYKKLKKEKEQSDTLLFEKISSDENLKKYEHSYSGKLTKRSTTAIIDYLNSATHDYFITGIINNSAINAFVNNAYALEHCCKEGIKIHVLFYVSDDEKNFEWYLQMLYGQNEPDKKIKIDKQNYNTYINTIKTYNIFKTLIEKDLLEVRRLNAPATTAFIATDILRSEGGKIQCQFYQFEKYSTESPVCQLISSDEMFPTMKDVLLDMWNSASHNLTVNYIKKDEKTIIEEDWGM